MTTSAYSKARFFLWRNLFHVLFQSFLQHLGVDFPWYAVAADTYIIAKFLLSPIFTMALWSPYPSLLDAFRSCILLHCVSALNSPTLLCHLNSYIVNSWCLSLFQYLDWCLFLLPKSFPLRHLRFSCQVVSSSRSSELSTLFCSLYNSLKYSFQSPFYFIFAICCGSCLILDKCQLQKLSLICDSRYLL